MQLLDIKDLRTYFFTDEGVVRAVDGVSLSIARGEIVGVVGESGSGKSVMSMSVMRLLPSPPGRIVGGSILFEGKDLVTASKREMESIRGNEISMIFQEPMSCLNPLFTVGEQIAEAIEIHQRVKRREAMNMAVDMLKLVGIPSPERRVYDYPHQLSGGMRQRVMIAMALSCEPKLLIADEPTTALDVTIQAQILHLIRDLRRRLGMAVLLITHDLAVIAGMADRVVVLYAGVVLEEGPTINLFEEPLHPYTRGLLESIPRLDISLPKLRVIKGVIPSPYKIPHGCRFAPRCPDAFELCDREMPDLVKVDGSRKVRCFKYQTIKCGVENE